MRKLGEMIILIAEKSASDAFFGATKLNKILFLIDFNAFALWGRSSSGTIYQHLQFGPVPSDCRVVCVGDCLMVGSIDIVDKRLGSFIQKRVVPR